MSVFLCFGLVFFLFLTTLAIIVLVKLNLEHQLKHAVNGLKNDLLSLEQKVKRFDRKMGTKQDKAVRFFHENPEYLDKPLSESAKECGLSLGTMSKARSIIRNKKR